MWGHKSLTELIAFGQNSRARNSDYQPSRVLDINDRAPFLMPILDAGTDKIDVGIGIAIQVVSDSSAITEESHLVVIAKVLGNQQQDAPYLVWCGDTFLEGKLLDDVKESRVASALQVLGQYALSKGSELNDSDTFKSMLAENFGQAPSSAYCNFWTRLVTSGGDTGCSHVGYVLGQYLAETDLNEIAAQIEAKEEELLNLALAGTSNPTTLGDQSELDPIDQQIESDLQSCPIPLMLIGETGASKTFRAQDYARRHNLPYFEIGGNSDVRPFDLTGHYLPIGNSNTIWIDGPFTEAFRAAQTQKVVFCADELFRMGPDELSFFLSRLNVRQDGRYYHRTGFLTEIKDGRANMEELSCPAENLLIIATTNLGAKYGITDRDPAIRRRFREIEVPLTQEFVTKVCGIHLKAKNFDIGLSSKFGAFWAKMRRASRDTGMGNSMVTQAPNLGVLARVIQKSREPADFAMQLNREITQWVATNPDGYSVTEQVADVRRIIDSYFGKL